MLLICHRPVCRRAMGSRLRRSPTWLVAAVSRPMRSAMTVNWRRLAGYHRTAWHRSAVFRRSRWRSPLTGSQSGQCAVASGRGTTTRIARFRFRAATCSVRASFGAPRPRARRRPIECCSGWPMPTARRGILWAPPRQSFRSQARLSNRSYSTTAWRSDIRRWSSRRRGILRPTPSGEPCENDAARLDAC